MGLTSHLSDAYDAFFILFFFTLEYDDDVSGEYDDAGSAFGFTSGSCSFSFFSKNSIGRVSISKSVGRASISESVGRVSISEPVGRVSG